MFDCSDTYRGLCQHELHHTISVLSWSYILLRKKYTIFCISALCLTVAILTEGCVSTNYITLSAFYHGAISRSVRNIIFSVSQHCLTVAILTEGCVSTNYQLQLTIYRLQVKISYSTLSPFTVLLVKQLTPAQINYNNEYIFLNSHVTLDIFL